MADLSRRVQHHRHMQSCLLTAHEFVLVPCNNMLRFVQAQTFEASQVGLKGAATTTPHPFLHSLHPMAALPEPVCCMTMPCKARHLWAMLVVLHHRAQLQQHRRVLLSLCHSSSSSRLPGALAQCRQP
jgi:hypothetical protein